MEGVLPVALGNTPRCNLEGHGVFKGAGGGWKGDEVGAKGGRRHAWTVGMTPGDSRFWLWVVKLWN